MELCDAGSEFWEMYESEFEREKSYDEERYELLPAWLHLE
jgi:hypothetical protein